MSLEIQWPVWKRGGIILSFSLKPQSFSESLSLDSKFHVFLNFPLSYVVEDGKSKLELS
jgi:hypothetical protein